MKRIISMILTLAMLLSVCPFQTYATETEPVEETTAVTASTEVAEVTETAEETTVATEETVAVNIPEETAEAVTEPVVTEETEASGEPEPTEETVITEVLPPVIKEAVAAATTGSFIYSGTLTGNGMEDFVTIAESFVGKNRAEMGYTVD